jgi:DNA invertase Pin-like site-specific DNA recombinase
MVVTKDLSRLGRDYIKTGYYIENYFPEHRVRYISVNDGIDTYIESTNNDITPFKALLNDMYAKDISKKIKSVFRQKQYEGQFMVTTAPYGYKKDKGKKGKLVVDDYSASIVKRIYEIYADGKGADTITNILNSENIVPPSTYTKTKSTNPNRKWNSTTIRDILKSKVYIRKCSSKQTE